MAKTILTDDNEWLKGFAVQLTNTSGKNINFVSVRITFVRPKDDPTASDPPLMHSITFGRNPFSVKDPATLNEFKTPPNGTVDVVLTDDTYEMLKRVLKKLRYPDDIKRVELLLEVVGFDDGTVWDMGRLFRRDETNKFIPIEEQGVGLIRGAQRPYKSFSLYVETDALDKAIFISANVFSQSFISCNPRANAI